MIYGLSCLCHPERGVRYVGLTTQGVSTRWANHLQDLRRRPYLSVYKWVRKHGVDNIRHVLLEQVGDPEALPEREIYWIAKLKDYGLNLTNMTDGGEGQLGMEKALQTRKKLSESNSGPRHWSKRHPELWEQHKLKLHGAKAREKASQTTKDRGNAGWNSWSPEVRERVAEMLRSTPKARSLDAVQAGEIRTRLSEGERVLDLAAEYGVGRSTIYNVKNHVHYV